MASIILDLPFMSAFPSVLESISDLHKNQIDFLLLKAKAFKEGQDPQKGKKSIICTLFYENSTRTRISFEIAAKKLGHDFCHLEQSTSSQQKGEKLRETLKTLKALGIGLCILRTPEKFSHYFSDHPPPLDIINGGDGQGEHPTQALVDIFTMKELGHDPQGRCVAIIGDTKHSRVFRSLSKLLPLFQAQVLTAGPKDLNNSSIALDEAIDRADILYLLRSQWERHGMKCYSQDWCLDLVKLKKRGKENVPIFHPGPANIGSEISDDLVLSPQYKALSQVEHSIPLRMALLECMLQEVDL